MSDVYVRLRPMAGGSTRELVAGQVLADFDAAGNLCGVEILGADSVKIDGHPVAKLATVANVPLPFPEDEE